MYFVTSHHCLPYLQEPRCRLTPPGLVGAREGLDVEQVDLLLRRDRGRIAGERVPTVDDGVKTDRRQTGNVVGL